MPKTDLVRPSRDGDQFHYLWAARRCLKLLSSQSNLVAISIEGASNNESQTAPLVTEGDELIDIAEYFGSEDLGRADKIRYMQLKHSTLHASEDWTASGLKKTLSGFAKRYVQLTKLLSKNNLANKIEFWFVSNRPISTKIIETIHDATSNAPVRHPNELKKLEEHCNLTGTTLTSFLDLLRFEGKQDPYWEQRNTLSLDIKNYLPGTDSEAPSKIKELVTRRALSEGEEKPTITKMDLLRALGTTERQLFPAPCSIEILSNPIHRAQYTDLQQKISTYTGSIIVHAAGGVGKSIWASQFIHSLPDKSINIVFDCFGNGQYRNASNYRHRHKDALVQIANEISAKGLCNPLVPTQQADSSDYIHAFTDRVTQASQDLKIKASNALLCIVIDAADNAQMAAEELGEKKSFVQDLIRESFPENVRLVFLCRSHRQTYLAPPTDTLKLELKAFNRDETATHLKQAFPEATNHDVEEFHRLSSANPRVQALALANNHPLSKTLRLLGPNPTTVEDTINSLLEHAIVELKDSVTSIEQEQIDKICAGLAVLRPLIPINVLAMMADVEAGAIESFALDIGRPLRVSGGSIQFLDEPAETWFRDNFKPDTASLKNFISSIKPLAKKSAYVASVLPHLMLEAEQLSDLVELTLASEALPDTTPLEIRDIELQRLQHALRASLRAQRYLDATKLVLKTGGEAAGNERHKELLQNNTDLAAHFLGTDLIQDIVSRKTFSSDWMGSHNAYEAGLLSWKSELAGEARSRLRMAFDWLHNYSRLPVAEQEKENVSFLDICELTIATLNIHGPIEAANSLRKWRPRTISYDVGRLVAKRLIEQGQIDTLDKLASAAGNDILFVLALNTESRSIQHTLPTKALKRTFKLLADRRILIKLPNNLNQETKNLHAVTSFIETALLAKVCTSIQAAYLLSRYLPDTPPRGLCSHFEGNRFSLLRAYCLHSALNDKILRVEDLAPADIKKELKKNNHNLKSQEAQEFIEIIGLLLPWHQLCVNVFLKPISKEQLVEEIGKTRDMEKTTYFRSYEKSHALNEVALIWLDVLLRIDPTSEKLRTNFSSWKKNLDRPLFTPTLRSLALLCCQFQSTHELAFDFVQEAFDIAAAETNSAEEKSEEYVAVARSILPLSPVDAKAYFNEAIDIANKIGDENLSRWDSILDLAFRAEPSAGYNPKLAYQFARSAELTYEYVVRDKHFDWASTVKALCCICPPSALAILSRWRDRKFGDSEWLLPTVIEYLLDQKKVQPITVLPLIAFKGEWNHLVILNALLDSCKTQSEKLEIVSYYSRYLYFSDTNFTAICEVLSRHDIKITSLEQVASLQAQEKDQAKQHATFHNEYKTRKEKDWSQVFSNCDLTKTEGIDQALLNLESTPPPWDRESLLFQMITHLSPGQEVAFLHAVKASNHFSPYEFRELIAVIPDSWKKRPAIKNALKEMLKNVCQRFCTRIRKHRHYEIIPFTEACTLTQQSEVELSQIVLNATAELQDLMEPRDLFSLTSLLATLLSQEEATEALQHGLDTFSPLFETTFGDGEWTESLLPPKDINESLAGYIWASLSAPERALRWQGAHAVLGLVQFNCQAPLTHLVNIATTNEGGTFVDQSLPFYSLHAQLWLLIGIARAAQEFPSSLSPFLNQLVAWTNQPHVLIRKFAAEATCSLIKNGIATEHEASYSKYAQINETPFPIKPSQKDYGVNFTESCLPKASEDDKYSFGWDFDQYWFAPLASVFNLEYHAIQKHILHTLRTEMNYQGDGYWNSDERAQKNIYNHELTRHDHGSYPRVDTLQFYHSYHAMMVTAGKLLATTPIKENDSYILKDSFFDWLERHELSRDDGRWLWDRRDTPPYSMTTHYNKYNDDEPTELAEEDFQNMLFEDEFINVFGGWTIPTKSAELNISVTSALVSSPTSSALLRALSTAIDPYDYAIPSYDSDHEIHHEDFTLKGWITLNESSRRLDSEDSWSGGISYPPPQPSSEIINAFKLSTDLDSKVWKNNHQNTVMQSQVWGHYYSGRHYENENPEQGSRLQANLTFLKEMLTTLDKQLIFELATIQYPRSNRYSSSSNHENKTIRNTKVYLLDSQGKLQTI